MIPTMSINSTNLTTCGATSKAALVKTYLPRAYRIVQIIILCVILAGSYCTGMLLHHAWGAWRYVFYSDHESHAIGAVGPISVKR